MGKKPRIRPTPMLINAIHVPKKDLPETKFPLDSDAFSSLKKMLKKKGMLTPVFVNQDGILLQGHYRLWAWIELGNKHVPTVTVDKPEEIIDWFF